MFHQSRDSISYAVVNTLFIKKEVEKIPLKLFVGIFCVQFAVTSCLSILAGIPQDNPFGLSNHKIL